MKKTTDQEMQINGIKITDRNLEDFYEFKQEIADDGEDVSFTSTNQHHCEEWESKDIEFSNLKATISRTCVECNAKTVLEFYLKPEFIKDSDMKILKNWIFRTLRKLEKADKEEI